MTKLSKILIFLAVFAVLWPLNLIAQESAPVVVVPTYRPSATISVSDKGEASVKNAVVFFVSGKALYARTYWGESYVKWTIRINDKTDLIKKFGGKIEVGDTKVGHILDVEGPLVAGTDTLNITATVIRDLTLEMEKAGFSGKVVRANNGSNTFVVAVDSGKEVTVKVNSSTVIKKGAIYIPLSKIVYGDTILSVDGTYHEPTKTITANNVEVYQTKKIFEPKNFEGILKSISDTELPITAVVSIGGVDYDFYLGEKASILNAKRLNAKLQRFVVGDRVRLYGKIRETNLNEVDAEIMRNLDL
ncbi:MAG: hypothetical protein A3B08_02475 [Candidatus Taylorbacteria bacterium RIFCSPLOWO2_01_FULL_43_44]|nr:MAG: hypothetical protein A3B08_02475 [Candidatus Taylorbacteria bacterium RIFCSPLOWO2_01_FULL_43_44]